VIIATQMLESMITSPRPTRAEASDVATAIYDGTDAVMLSAETASGEYPIEAVTIMDKIATDVEKDDLYRKIMDAEHPKPDNSTSDAIVAAASEVATTIGAAVIVNFTTSGKTALRTVRERPSVPILCLSESLAVARHMRLSYGVYPVLTEGIDNFGDMVKKGCKVALEHGFATKGQKLVITAGVPFGMAGSTNILRVAVVE
jgi:pyruvate kinase